MFIIMMNLAWIALSIFSLMELLVIFFCMQKTSIFFWELVVSELAMEQPWT